MSLLEHLYDPNQGLLVRNYFETLIEITLKDAISYSW